MCIFYTDWHDVDEDIRTIVSRGGSRDSGIATGVINQLLLNSPTNYIEYAASSNMKNSQIIRICIMSTKMRRLLPVMVGSVSMRASQVLHAEICVILHPILTVLLLH